MAKKLPGASPLVFWELALLYGNSLKRYREAAEELEAYLERKTDLKDRETVKKLIVQFRVKAKEENN